MRLFKRAPAPRQPRRFLTLSKAAAGGSGTASPNLADLTSSATGVLPIAGAANQTLAAATSTAAGRLSISGAAGIALADLASTAAGASTLQGSSAGQLAPLGLAASGTTSIVGQLAVTLGSLTLAASEEIAEAVILSPAQPVSQPIARRTSAPTMWARREEEEEADLAPLVEQPQQAEAQQPSAQSAVAEQMRALAEQATRVESQARTKAARFVADMKALERPLYAPLANITPESLAIPEWDDEEESALLLL